MEKQVLYQEQGITYKLFTDAADSYITPATEELPAHLLIPEVVRQKDIRFFKVPRLGSYMSIKLEYESCMSEKALDEAIVDWDRYEVALDNIEADKEDWEKAEAAKK